MLKEPSASIFASSVLMTEPVRGSMALTVPIPLAVVSVDCRLTRAYPVSTAPLMVAVLSAADAAVVVSDPPQPLKPSETAASAVNSNEGRNFGKRGIVNPLPAGLPEKYETGAVGKNGGANRHMNRSGGGFRQLPGLPR